MRRFFLFLILLYFSGYALFAISMPRVIGEISRIDRVNGKIEIEITEPEMLAEFSQNKVWFLFDDKGKKTGEIGELRLVTRHQKTYLQANLLNYSASIYTGMPAGVMLPEKKAPNLPDTFKSQPQPARVYINQRDQSEMLLVAAGPFVFGSDILGTLHYTAAVEKDHDPISAELGRKRITYLNLADFYIDKYEISNAQFALFLKSTAEPPPPGWNWQYAADQPVDNVSYTQAEKYCQWADKRLPTEMEWEKAARGPGISTLLPEEEVSTLLSAERIYPIGLDYDAARCPSENSGLESPLPVKSLQDDSFYGVKGMCGNVAEWTSSWLLPYRGNSQSHSWYGRQYKVIRGGAYNLPARWTKSYERMAGGIPSLADDHRAGFRCARSL